MLRRWGGGEIGWGCRRKKVRPPIGLDSARRVGRGEVPHPMAGGGGRSPGGTGQKSR